MMTSEMAPPRQGCLHPRVVFMGTPEFACPTLKALLEAEISVVAVLTRAPREAGRGQKLKNTPVHDMALAHNIPVFTPKSLRHMDIQQTLEGLKPDIIVVVAYGLLLPKEVLQIPTIGCFNLHASKLPRWRGAAPIHRAIMHGDQTTAVAVMRMEEGLDTGPVGLEKICPITPATTTGELHDCLAQEGARLMVKALHDAVAGTLIWTPQALDGVTYATKISKEETRLDIFASARAACAFIHGLSPFPGAWLPMELADGRTERLKILRVREATPTTDQASKQLAPGTWLRTPPRLVVGAGEVIELMELQREGRPPRSAEECFRGLRWKGE